MALTDGLMDMMPCRPTLHEGYQAQMAQDRHVLRGDHCKVHGSQMGTLQNASYCPYATAVHRARERISLEQPTVLEPQAR
jgi:hypothetical protein